MAGWLSAGSLILGCVARRWAAPLVVIASATATFPFAMTGAIAGTDGTAMAMRYWARHASVAVVLIAVAAILVPLIDGVVTGRRARKWSDRGPR